MAAKSALMFRELETVYSENESVFRATLALEVVVGAPSIDLDTVSLGVCEGVKGNDAVFFEKGEWRGELMFTGAKAILEGVDDTGMVEAVFCLM